MSVCKHCIVKGRVQGVFFRASTQDKAMELGLKGFARNLPDGSVEVLACGSSDKIAALEDWLWQGSPMSEVSEVKCFAIQPEVIPNEFLTR